jgi:hypothetical protein
MAVPKFKIGYLPVDGLNANGSWICAPMPSRSPGPLFFPTSARQGVLGTVEWLLWLEDGNSRHALARLFEVERRSVEPRMRAAEIVSRQC